MLPSSPVAVRKSCNSSLELWHRRIAKMWACYSEVASYWASSIPRHGEIRTCIAGRTKACLELLGQMERTETYSSLPWVRGATDLRVTIRNGVYCTGQCSVITKGLDFHAVTP